MKLFVLAVAVSIVIGTVLGAALRLLGFEPATATIASTATAGGVCGVVIGLGQRRRGAK